MRYCNALAPEFFRAGYGFHKSSMIGIITAYSGTVNMGYIDGPGGKTYKFSRKDWHGETPPGKNMRVVFDTVKDSAVNVTADGNAATNPSPAF